jgi:molybdopterin synthase catalytic subunit
MKSYETFIQGPIPPILVADVVQSQSSRKGVGAHSIFLGQVRNDEIDGKTVISIDYSIYEKMALQIIENIKAEMSEKYLLDSISIHHSLGNVPVGELCLLVFTAGRHRKAAIEACQDTVERIKIEVPVWGQEIFEDQTSKWKVNTSIA